MTGDEKLEYLFSLYEIENLTEEHQKILYDFCYDKDAEIRMRACELLGEFPSEETEIFLVSMLNDSDYLVRAMICDTLSFGNADITVENLKKMTKDKNTLVRGYAVLSMADIQKKKDDNAVMYEQTIIYLENLLHIEIDEWVKICIYRSLILLGDKMYVALFLKGIEHKKYSIRCLVLNLLNELIDQDILKYTSEMHACLKEIYKKEESTAVKEILKKLVNKFNL